MKKNQKQNPYQVTLKRPVSCRGIGLHSGRPASMSIIPAPVGNGIRFRRTDLPEGKTIPAYMNRIVDTRMATTIAEDRVSIATTEHLLAALSGLGVDNAIIELDSGEVPIMDGSADPFVTMISEAGLRRQRGNRRLVSITRPIAFSHGERSIRIEPYDGFKISAAIDFPHALINRQQYTFELSPAAFSRDIASARTFGFLKDVEKLHKNGLALGGSLDNAVVMDENGIVNREGLRYADEFVRHKILDLIGDLALLGCPLRGHVTAFKAGHGQHLALMQRIAASPDAWEFVELRENGQFSILDKVVYTTRAARNRLLPFLTAYATDLNP